MNDLAIAIPAASIDALDALVQSIDGPTVTAREWFQLRYSLDPAVTAADEPTHYCAHFSAATNEQKSVLVYAEVAGLAMVQLGEGVAFDDAMALLSLYRVPDEDV